ncbi:MAG: glucose 1-dehydrogenase [Spirochaetaceae bacterium]|nr:glucose 1-dehydrogenase [Spirochaetaceae bacterium]
MGLLEDKVGLVTGAGRGIGRETALVFGREGARVVVADVDFEAAKETAALVEAEGFEALAIEVDVADEASVERMIASTLERFGRLDCASNNAALGAGFRPSTELDRARWDRCLAVTLTGVWLCAKHEIPAMLATGGGAIVNISSLSGIKGQVRQAAYAAAKGGVIALTRSLAAEFATRGIRVNSVAPGGIETDGLAAYFADNPQIVESTKAVHAMRRLGRPHEIADAVAYLCSDRSSFVTGEVLHVDGGITINAHDA